MMGAGSIGGLPYAPIGAFLRQFRLQMVWGRVVGNLVVRQLRFCGRVSGVLKK